jgi:hypothetical protein
MQQRAMRACTCRDDASRSARVQCSHLVIHQLQHVINVDRIGGTMIKSGLELHWSAVLAAHA